MRTRKQTPISARIDSTILWKVDQEAMLGYITRNGILNKGADIYCHLQDIRRALRVHQNQDTSLKILRGWISVYMPEARDLIPG